MAECNSPPSCRHWRLTAGLVFSLLLNVLILCLAVYGSQVILDMKNDIHLLQQRPCLHAREHKNEAVVQQRLNIREILSSSKEQTLLQSQVQDGNSDAGGSISTQVDLLKEVINETVNREWASLSDNLPNYGGATFTRWGRKNCPSSSKLIYSGQMAAPDNRANGGGVNPLCLPSDPQYDSNAPNKAYYGSITALQLEIMRHPNIFTSYKARTPTACAVCESNQRLTKLMIPAYVSCPSSSWQLEFKGYLMSAASNAADGSFITDGHQKTTYVCVDQQAESFSSFTVPNEQGVELHFNKAQCSGEGALGNCPPYQIDKALSCVVCTK